MTFTYTPEILSALESSISKERLKSYMAATANVEDAIRLYLWNTAVSDTLYAPLQTLEVSLRNSINRELSALYGTKWYENKKPTLFVDAQADKITKVISRFDKNRPLTTSDVVAGLSFGFWADLIEHKVYENLWNKCIHKSFPHRPAGTKRSTAAIPVKRLNTLRNRIAHHEPIWNRNLQHDYDLIIGLISWICPATSEWTKRHNRFEIVLKDRPK